MLRLFDFEDLFVLLLDLLLQQLALGLQVVDLNPEITFLHVIGLDDLRLLHLLRAMLELQESALQLVLDEAHVIDQCLRADDTILDRVVLIASLRIQRVLHMNVVVLRRLHSLEEPFR